MTTQAHGFIGSRPSHRNVKLIWVVFAVVALAALTTVILLMSTGSDHAKTTATFAPLPTRSHSAVAINDDCRPTRVIHPC